MVKTLKNLLRGNQKADDLETWYTRVLEYHYICSNAGLGLTLTYFTARSNWSFLLLYWKKGKTMDISETIGVSGLKLATDVEVTRSFCRHQNFVPWGLSAPVPGLYTKIKSCKNLYKIRHQRVFFKLATNK